MPRRPTTEQVRAADAAAKRKAEEHAAAAKQARADAEAKVTYKAAKVPKGTQVPLHAANMDQRATSTAMRDEIESAAKAAGKAVKTSLRSAGGMVARLQRRSKQHGTRAVQVTD